MRNRTIIFNGVGSVGKSTTIEAMQRVLQDPYLHVAGDAFLEMIPPQMWGDADGITFQERDEEGCRAVEIVMGDGFQRVMDGMRASVGALAETGNFCMVDDVMLTAEDQSGYLRYLERNETVFVGLHASLEVLEHRERERGDRLIGLARWQFDRVNQSIEYDYEYSTENASPDQLAQVIADDLRLTLRGN